MVRSSQTEGVACMAAGMAMIVLILGLWSSVSFAQETVRGSKAVDPRGTSQEEAACRRDVRRFCRDIPDSAGSLSFLICLKQNRDKISKACQNVLISHGQ
jgi:hypothetical protein